MPEPTWRRSSRCDSGTCVEVALDPDGLVLVRDSKDPGPVLVFDPAEWDDFVAGVKAGEFDTNRERR